MLLWVHRQTDRTEQISVIHVTVIFRELFFSIYSIYAKVQSRWMGIIVFKPHCIEQLKT
jgi:hypothetical protein